MGSRESPARVWSGLLNGGDTGENVGRQRSSTLSTACEGVERCVGGAAGLGVSSILLGPEITIACWG